MVVRRDCYRIPLITLSRGVDQGRNGTEICSRIVLNVQVRLRLLCTAERLMSTSVYRCGWTTLVMRLLAFAGSPTRYVIRVYTPGPRYRLALDDQSSLRRIAPCLPVPLVLTGYNSLECPSDEICFLSAELARRLS